MHEHKCKELKAEGFLEYRPRLSISLVNAPHIHRVGVYTDRIARNVSIFSGSSIGSSASAVNHEEHSVVQRFERRGKSMASIGDRKQFSYLADAKSIEHDTNP